MLNAALLTLEAWLSRRHAARPAEPSLGDFDLRPLLRMLGKLQVATGQLREYASQKEELAANRNATAWPRSARLGQSDDLQRYPYGTGVSPAAGSRPGASSVAERSVGSGGARPAGGALFTSRRILLFILPLVLVRLILQPFFPQEHDWAVFFFLMARFVWASSCTRTRALLAPSGGLGPSCS